MTQTFQPKALVLWTSGQTTEATYAEHYVLSYGFSDGTNDACQQMVSRDNDTVSSVSYSFNNNCIISIHDITTPSTQISRADVASFDTDGFTLNWSVQTDTTAMVIHYVAIGGTDITNASVVNTTIASTATGNRSYTGSGTSFTPDFALIMTGQDAYTTVNTVQTTGAAGAAGINFGACSGTGSEQYAVSVRTEAAAATSDTDQLFLNNGCMSNLDNAAGTTALQANFVSFNNAAGGGITVNITNGATSASQLVSFLLIKGGLWEAGSFQQRSGTGTQNVTFSDTTINPALVFLGGPSTATAATPQVSNWLTLGASDKTTEGCTWTGDSNGQGTMVVTRINLTSKIWRTSWPAVTATSSTNNAECNITSMAAGGQFTLNWTTADTTLRYMGFWVVGTTYVTPPPFIIKTGVFAKRSGSGAQVVRGLGLQPKAIMFYVTTQTATGITDRMDQSVGITDGTNMRCVGTNIGDNVTFGGNANGNNRPSTYMIDLNDGTNTHGASITSFNADGFTITWASSTADPFRIYYLAIGGTDVTNVKVGGFAASASTGNVAVTDPGFQPTLTIFLPSNSANIFATGHRYSSIGLATSSTSQGSIAILNGSNVNSLTVEKRYNRTDKCISGLTASGSTATTEYEASFVSADTNGFTLNWNDATAVGHYVYYLAIKTTDTAFAVLNTAMSAGTGSQAITTTGIADPVALFGATVGLTSATTTFQTEGRIALFSATSFPDLKQNHIFNASTDGVGTSITANENDNASLVKFYTEAATASSSTLEFAANVTSFDSGGFTINKSTNTGTLGTFALIYVVAGTESAPTGNNVERALPTETLTSSDSRIVSRNKIRARTETVTASG